MRRYFFIISLCLFSSALSYAHQLRFNPVYTTTGKIISYDQLNRKLYVMTEKGGMLETKLISASQAQSLERGWPNSVTQMGLQTSFQLDLSNTQVKPSAHINGKTIQVRYLPEQVFVKNGLFFKPTVQSDIAVQNATIQGIEQIETTKKLNVNAVTVESSGAVRLKGNVVKLTNTHIKQGASVVVE